MATKRKSTNKLGKELKELVDETQKKAKEQTKETIPKPLEEKGIVTGIQWDVKKDDDILFFDSNLSYELTGYRPINGILGLDFDPSWFTEARETWNRTGHYTEFRPGSKAFRDFWLEQYRRCKYGMVVNGYTITGDHYFFLNFYRLKDLVNVTEAGGGRNDIFPDFLVCQYEWFHYLKLAKILRMNALMMKAREIGYSEMEASIVVNSYNCIRGSINVCAAFADNLLGKLMEKVTGCMNFLNNHTDGGFFKSRLVIDTATLKRASQYKMVNGQKIEVGWMSLIQAICADRPTKLNGDRTDVLIFEETGQWPGLTKAFTNADALVGLVGRLWGIRLLGGRIA